MTHFNTLLRDKEEYEKELSWAQLSGEKLSITIFEAYYHSKLYRRLTRIENEMLKKTSPYSGIIEAYRPRFTPQSTKTNNERSAVLHHLEKEAEEAKRTLSLVSIPLQVQYPRAELRAAGSYIQQTSILVPGEISNSWVITFSYGGLVYYSEARVNRSLTREELRLCRKLFLEISYYNQMDYR